MNPQWELNEVEPFDDEEPEGAYAQRVFVANDANDVVETITARDYLDNRNRSIIRNTWSDELVNLSRQQRRDLLLEQEGLGNIDWSQVTMPKLVLNPRMTRTVKVIFKEYCIPWLSEIPWILNPTVTPNLCRVNPHGKPDEENVTGDVNEGASTSRDAILDENVEVAKTNDKATNHHVEIVDVTENNDEHGVDTHDVPNEQVNETNVDPEQEGIEVQMSRNNLSSPYGYSGAQRNMPEFFIPTPEEVEEIILDPIRNDPNTTPNQHEKIVKLIWYTK